MLLSKETPESFDLSVHGVQIGGGHWEPYERPKKLMEEALARTISVSPTAAKAAHQNSARGQGSTTGISNLKDAPQADQLTNIAAATPVAVQEVDEEEVMRCLGNTKLSDSGLVLDLVDFGGQAVFNVLHHLFIKKYGVYLLTFNMEWLADSAESEKREMCLNNLAFWMNSIYIHTARKDLEGLEQTARVVFVGTRKDLVSEVGQHEPARCGSMW